MLENYLKGASSGYEEVLDGSEAEAGSRTSAVAEFLAGRSFLSCERVARILERVRDLQGRAGYRGDYRVNTSPRSRGHPDGRSPRGR